MINENEETKHWYRLAMRKRQKAEDNLRLAETRAMMITDLWHKFKQLRADLAAKDAEIERLTATRAVKLCPECERETEHTKYCEVWECSVCGCDSEQNFAKLEGGAQ